MSRRGREREVRDGVGNLLRARGASDHLEFLSGVGVLIENCKRHDLLDFRYPDHNSIGEGLEELREKREAVELTGNTYIQDGGGANREAWHHALAEWVGVLEGTTMLMHVALGEAGVEPDNTLLPVDLVEIVPGV